MLYKAGRMYSENEQSIIAIFLLPLFFIYKTLLISSQLSATINLPGSKIIL